MDCSSNEEQLFVPAAEALPPVLTVQADRLRAEFENARQIFHQLRSRRGRRSEEQRRLLEEAQLNVQATREVYERALQEMFPTNDPYQQLRIEAKRARQTANQLRSRRGRRSREQRQQIQEAEQNAQAAEDAFVRARHGILPANDPLQHLRDDSERARQILYRLRSLRGRRS